MREERVARPRRERAHEAKPETRPDGEHPLSPVLLLQRHAGNRAVGALLARDGEPDKAEERGTSMTVVFPDPIGVLPVDAFSFGSAGEISLVIPSSAKDPELIRMGQEGAFFDQVVISTAGMKIIVTKAAVASVQASGHGQLSVTIVGQIGYDRPQTTPPGAVDAPV
jgi:hypothetical protein